MKEDPVRYTLVITPTARRQLAQRLPEAAAFAAHEFIVGALLDNPYRLGKRLDPPLDDRHSARRDAYRARADLIELSDQQCRTP